MHFATLFLCASSFGHANGQFFKIRTDEPVSAPTPNDYDDYFVPEPYPTPKAPKVPTPYSDGYQPYHPPLLSTEKPTKRPTPKPTPRPTQGPKIPYPVYPVPTVPIPQPSPEPTTQPTSRPTPDPTPRPTIITATPTKRPTPDPTPRPTTGKPTGFPTFAPTLTRSEEPSPEPSATPSIAPSAAPSVEPTSEPSSEPTSEPSDSPTPQPTLASEEPSEAPTTSEEPSESPTGSEEPSEEPTESLEPSGAPTISGTSTAPSISSAPSTSSVPSGVPTGSTLISLAEIICNPQNAKLFSTLCNIIQQLPDLENTLEGSGRRKLNGNRILADSSASLTVFAATNRAFDRAPIDIDFQSDEFTMDEKLILKDLIQTHIIGNNVVKSYDELECDQKFRTLTGEQVQVRCVTNSRLNQQKFLVSHTNSAFGEPGTAVVLSTRDAKIISKDNVPALNGIIHAVNNVIMV